MLAELDGAGAARLAGLMTWIREEYTAGRPGFREPVGLTEAAAFGGVSPSHMSKLFRANMGIGLKEYLTMLRLNHAEQLLRLTGESVIDVAESCGFGTVSHFIHVFREKFGLPPLQYRKASLQNPPKERTM